MTDPWTKIENMLKEKDIYLELELKYIYKLFFPFLFLTCQLKVKSKIEKVSIKAEVKCKIIRLHFYMNLHINNYHFNGFSM